MVQAKSIRRLFPSSPVLAVLALATWLCAPWTVWAGQAQAAAAQTAASLHEAPASLANAANARQLLDFLGITLSSEQQAFLNAHKFLLVPQAALKKSLPPPPCAMIWDDMLTMSDAVGGEPIEQLRKPENARLITPDLVLHAYHKLFDNTLEYLETTELARQLYFFLLAIQRSALEEKRVAKPDVASRLERIAAQLTVPLILLESASWRPERASPHARPYDAEASRAEATAALARLDALSGEFQPETVQAMKKEMENIFAAEAVDVTPLFWAYARPDDPKGYTGKMDYTLLTPRGHYAKSARSRAYFRSVAYLGQAQWPLGQDPGLGDALILAYLMDKPGPGGQPALDAWYRLSKAATLFAGKPGEPDCTGVQLWLGWTFGEWRPNLEESLDPAVHSALTAKLSGSQKPWITGLTAKASMRLLGQGLTRDGWVLSELFAEKWWAAPSALFVAAALGDSTAKGFAQEHLERTSPPGREREVADLAAELEALTNQVAGWPLGYWRDSLTSIWLSALKALAAQRGPDHPAYMRSAPFGVKQLQTILGSFAELKHDTILYAKQPEAECGEGSDTPPPPVPKGFVEPGAAFWKAMTDLVAHTREGLEGVNLSQWERFEQDIRFLAEVAGKESANQPVSAQEYERLRTLRLNVYATPLGGYLVPGEEDAWTGLVADVLTDRFKKTVLYEATGRHYVMLALVGNEDSPRLVAGVAFNHYEFTKPIERRMTDQEWQAAVYKGQGKLPEKNFWYKGLVPGE